jgi:hypothetical protein
MSSSTDVRGCIQKFPDWIDNEITTTTNTRWKATRRVTAAKLTRLTHKIAINLHIVTKSCIICISLSRRSVRKLLDSLAYPSKWVILWRSLLHPSLSSHTFYSCIHAHRFRNFSLSLSLHLVLGLHSSRLFDIFKVYVLKGIVKMIISLHP